LSCEEWLRWTLKDHEMHLCEIVRFEAKKAGFSMGQLKTARKHLGVKTFHQFNEYGETPNWFWYLED